MQKDHSELTYDREDDTAMKLTESWIVALAPNSAAVLNGRKLSQKGNFSQLNKTQDETLFWGDCAGSGKNPYHTSIDFSNETAPTCRCSCPSRQFPCKHAIGLMFEIMAEKSFSIQDVPEDIASKRAKQAARAEKKVAPNTPSEKPKKTNQATKAKKIQKQLEGIEKAEQMVSDLLSLGLGTLTGASAKSYETLAKDLGSYYLTGAQTEFVRLAREIKVIQKNPDPSSYHEAIRILIRLNALLQKSRSFLQDKLDRKDYAAEDNLLYEALGGIWKLEELEEIGSYQENAQLVQLSFDVLFDEAKKEYVDRGYWMELQGGKIYQTLNYRPVKALKYIKADDTCFDVVKTPKLFCYPGTGNQRVRWDSFELEPIQNDILKTAAKFAQADFSLAVKEVKNEIKNTLSEKYLGVTLAFHKLGKIGDELALQSQDGQCIILRDRAGDGPSHSSTLKLEWLPNEQWKENQVIFGLLYYDPADARICLHPYSLITDDQIVRLQY